MDVQAVRPHVIHAGRRLGAYLLISGALAFGALAWATDGFRAFPNWSDLREWKRGEVLIDLPDIDQPMPSDYVTKD